MIEFWLPGWVKTILSKYSDLQKITEADFDNLKNRLKKFNVVNPLASIVIPAWNEEENITIAIASLAFNEFDFPCELLVVNNNSTDQTQMILDKLGVRSILETTQGTAHARQRGLIESKGKYHLCCDSDTIYPSTWIKSMVETLKKNEKQGVACVSGSYSFFPSERKSRFSYAIYELGTYMVRLFKSKNTDFIRVLGFNFGFIREVGIQVNGFQMEKSRKFRNLLGSTDYVAAAEDGLMALNIKKSGYKLLLKNNLKSRVWTSDRRILIDGGLYRAVKLRLLKIFNQKSFYKKATSGLT